MTGKVWSIADVAVGGHTCDMHDQSDGVAFNVSGREYSLTCKLPAPGHVDTTWMGRLGGEPGLGVAGNGNVTLRFLGEYAYGKQRLRLGVRMGPFWPM